MTIQECYAALGGDYEDVLGRLYSEALVKKFVGKFLADQSFSSLESTLKAKNYEEAFRAAHTLKGVSQNLSFTKLYQSCAPLCEALRGGFTPEAPQLAQQVAADYAQTVEAIRTFQAKLPA